MNSNEQALVDLGKKAKEASKQLHKLSQQKKKEVLQHIATCIQAEAAYILQENKKDILEAQSKQMKTSLLDRLTLNDERIDAIAEGMLQVAELEDPIGEVISMKTRPNGLQIGKKRVPLGVVGIIYEARPNVTIDAFALCFKTGNSTVLRGGSDAIHSNKALVTVVQKGLRKMGVSEYAVVLVEDTSRESALAMMKLNEYIDVLIPRGGAGLIETVVQNSTVPVIETGTGNCHIYVDEEADIQMAVDIIINAKTQRYGVCNACESLVVHHKIANKALPSIYEALVQHQVEIRGDAIACEIIADIHPAVEADWGTEYLDAIISVKIVESLEEAIAHINQYNTGHSEAIITNNYAHAIAFQEEIDAAAVYVNASTRFTDGFEFGFGAEIGISTQKLHARGPMGLEALTSSKYIVFGNGQIR